MLTAAAAAAEAAMSRGCEGLVKLRSEVGTSCLSPSFVVQRSCVICPEPSWRHRDRLKLATAAHITAGQHPGGPAPAGPMYINRTPRVTPCSCRHLHDWRHAGPTTSSWWKASACRARKTGCPTDMARTSAIACWRCWCKRSVATAAVDRFRLDSRTTRFSNVNGRFRERRSLSSKSSRAARSLKLTVAADRHVTAPARERHLTLKPLDGRSPRCVVWQVHTAVPVLDERWPPRQRPMKSRVPLIALE
ncbi:hypothetical protein DES41_106435 [Pseudorhodoferax soli]|uniref:Uncharacterized protein n=1 Tax=Pseudorhodoferax soli TaxID=545864 RepID=A0A368XNI8_9BURK|nr:hypothetical protein DES41_106435 [Pseudorhodoferax soli]